MRQTTHLTLLAALLMYNSYLKSPISHKELHTRGPDEFYEIFMNLGLKSDNKVTPRWPNRLVYSSTDCPSARGFNRWLGWPDTAPQRWLEWQRIETGRTPKGLHDSWVVLGESWEKAMENLSDPYSVLKILEWRKRVGWSFEEMEKARATRLEIVQLRSESSTPENTLESTSGRESTDQNGSANLDCGVLQQTEAERATGLYRLADAAELMLARDAIEQQASLPRDERTDECFGSSDDECLTPMSSSYELVELPHEKEGGDIETEACAGMASDKKEA